jgi:hypothetical protein
MLIFLFFMGFSAAQHTRRVRSNRYPRCVAGCAPFTLDSAFQALNHVPGVDTERSRAATNAKTMPMEVSMGWSRHVVAEGVLVIVALSPEAAFFLETPHEIFASAFPGSGRCVAGFVSPWRV